LNLKLVLTREGLPCRIGQFVEKISGSENHSKAPGLPQSEIAGNEEHHNNNTNDIENIVHVSFSFLSRDRVTVELHALSATQRKGRREASLVVLPSDEAQWELTVSDIIRISVLHPGYAFKPLL
jgi:hypothetical protein